MNGGVGSCVVPRSVMMRGWADVIGCDHICLHFDFDGGSRELLRLLASARMRYLRVV